jgi:hypothetical protein
LLVGGKLSREIPRHNCPARVLQHESQFCFANSIARHDKLHKRVSQNVLEGESRAVTAHAGSSFAGNWQLATNDAKSPTTKGLQIVSVVFFMSPQS